MIRIFSLIINGCDFIFNIFAINWLIFGITGYYNKISWDFNTRIENEGLTDVAILMELILIGGPINNTRIITYLS